MTDLTTQPLNLQNGSYTANQDRLLLDSIKQGEGVVGALDFSCTAASLTVTAKAGEAFVKGTTNSDQGIYNAVSSSDIAVNVDTNSGGANPRVDQIILRIYDKTVVGGLYDKASIEVVKGTVTSGATLDNRNGVAALPASCILLADVLLAAGGSTISSIRNRRKIIGRGVVPPIVTGTTTSVVGFEGVSGVFPQYISSSLAHASHDTKQVALLQYLPTRIANATKIKFRLGHSATALAGNYNIAICDASGRPIVSTGSTALTGSASTSALQSATITSTTFEAGLYYVLIGLDTSAGTADCFGYHSYSAYAPNIGFHATSGGTTLPTTILSLTDTSTATPAVVTALPVLPQVMLATA